MKNNNKTYKLTAQELQDLAIKILRSVGVPAEIAEFPAKGLVWTSLRGIDSHGIRLLPHYLAGVEGGRINHAPKMYFEQTAPATGLVEADHTFGHAAGMKAMQHALELAQESGIGAVGVRNSSHCGAMSWFAHEAARQDMIGVAFTHATPRVKSPGASRSFFGNNPICFVAPMYGEEPFCFDAATTAITFNAVKAAAASGENLPHGVVADGQGCMTIDPNKAEQLIPIGDYKGFGISMVVDILCAMLTGMPGGNQISKMFDESMSKNRKLGHFFCAINIASFQDVINFKIKLKEMVDDVRVEPALNPKKPVIVPGDPEKLAWKTRTELGIPIPKHVLDEIKLFESKYNNKFK